MLTTEQKQDIARIINQVAKTVDQQKLNALANHDVDATITLFDKQIQTIISSDRAIKNDLSKGAIISATFFISGELFDSLMSGAIDIIERKYNSFLRKEGDKANLEFMKFADVEVQKAAYASRDAKFVTDLAHALQVKYPNQFKHSDNVKEFFADPYVEFEFADGTSSPLVNHIDVHIYHKANI